MHVSFLKTKNNKNKPTTYSKRDLQSAVNMASSTEGTSRDWVRNLGLWWRSLPVRAWPRPLPCPPASTQPVLLSSGHSVFSRSHFLAGWAQLTSPRDKVINTLEINTGMMTPWCDWENKADVTAAGVQAHEPRWLYTDRVWGRRAVSEQHLLLLCFRGAEKPPPTSVLAIHLPSWQFYHGVGIKALVFQN